MRTRISEASDYNIMLNAMNELTHGYDSDGREYPTYFDIDEFASNFGVTYEEVIDIAENNGYNVYRLPGGDNLVTRTVVAHENLSYGDIVEEDTTKVDIEELGESTNNSFSLEEAYMDDVKPFNKRQVYDELKRETYNFTKEDTFSYSFESEARAAWEILSKHYDDVDYWSDNRSWGTGVDYFVQFKDPKKGKKKIKESSNPLVGKKVKHKDEECTIENVEEEDDDVYFTLSNGKKVSVKICVERGVISSDDAEVNAFLDKYKVEEEPEVETSTDDVDKNDPFNNVEQQAIRDADDDWEENKPSLSPMYLKIKKAKGNYADIPTARPELYADAYKKEYDRLRGKDNVENRFREEAVKRIKNSLIVEKIAQIEDIKIEQKDIMEHINQLAAMYGMPPVQLFEELRRSQNSFAAISQQITAGKVNEFLLNNNKFNAK